MANHRRDNTKLRGSGVGSGRALQPRTHYQWEWVTRGSGGALPTHAGRASASPLQSAGVLRPDFARPRLPKP